MTRAPRCASGEKQREMQQGTIHGKHQVRGQPSICITNCAERDGELTAQKDGVALGFGRQVAGSNRRPSSGLGRETVCTHIRERYQAKKKGRPRPPQSDHDSRGSSGLSQLVARLSQQPGRRFNSPGAQGFDAHEIFLSPTRAREFPGWYNPRCRLDQNQGREPNDRDEP